MVDVGLTGQIGQDVVIRHSFRDRLGYVIAAADTGPAAARAADAGLLALTAPIAAASVAAGGSHVDGHDRSGPVTG